MAEQAGKVGAIYAPTGTGTLVENESKTLVAGVIDLTNENVLVSKVTSDAEGITPITKRWTVTVKGHLVVEDGGTDTVYITYHYWAEGQYGNDGEIGEVGGFFNWSIAQAAGILDKTDFQSGAWKEFMTGLKEWSATAEKHWITDESLAAWLGTLKIIKFYLDVDATPKLRYEGWAIITGLNPAVAVDTLINESLTFQGTGQLSYEST